MKFVLQVISYILTFKTTYFVLSISPISNTYKLFLRVLRSKIVKMVFCYDQILSGYDTLNFLKMVIYLEKEIACVFSVLGSSNYSENS